MSHTKPRGVGGAESGWADRAAASRAADARVPSKRLGDYLRQLREGYGYTLRKVEERAQALGESIDNSQLSRFEKGKAVPSFDKIRALAKIFNVTVQNFSDVLDLEEFARFTPTEEDYDTLMRSGKALFDSGEHGKAFVTYERALEIVRGGDGRAEHAEQAEQAEKIAAARRAMAYSLKRLGKLSLTEAELRSIFRDRKHLSRRTHLRCLLELSHVHRQLGDLYIASLLCKESLELAVEDGDLETQASVLNHMGSIHYEEGDFEPAVEYYQRALELFENLGFQKLRLTALTNLGAGLVLLHRFDEGVAKLREAHTAARRQGYRRITALSMNRLGEAYMLRGDYDSAKQHLAESDALASRPEETYNDILFCNAYLRWMAREEDNRTGETIAFGQLRRLRSRIERKFSEVLEFDRYVERARRHHA
jgi:tetratricopeptide (TPR) repeat protein